MHPAMVASNFFTQDRRARNVMSLICSFECLADAVYQVGGNTALKQCFPNKTGIKARGILVYTPLCGVKIGGQFAGD
ncbi:unnamed protein product [marine sediment metagenome]|uniref:Uncharacterized protein n=1 Tax=marine sediment metagenome TaxID=412755 RepID=X1SWI6_9ZZZZ